MRRVNGNITFIRHARSAAEGWQGGMSLETEQDFQKILDNAIRDITKRIAGIDLETANWPQDENGDVASLYTVTKGSYRITVVYHAETRLLRYIADKMARRPVEDPEDMEMYAKEYFNILCGSIVSKINQITNSSARFGIPQYCRGFYAAEDYPGVVLEVSYRSIAGGLQLQSCYSGGEDTKTSDKTK